MPKGIAVHAAAIQFDPSAIPPGSQVVSATLEMTGAKMSPDAKLSANLKVLHVISTPLGKARLSDLDQCPSQSGGSQTITHLSLGDGKVNKFKIDPNVVEEFRTANNKITFRIDGPDYDLASYWAWFIWWSGNEAATAHLGPRLIVEYAALNP